MIRRSYLLLILLLILPLLVSSCSKERESPIVTINDNKLYLNDLLYEIYKTETEGNQMEDYYQSKLQMSYWDYKFNGTTMRELAKNSILANVVMDEILSDEAKQKGITLTKSNISKIDKKIKKIFASSSKTKLVRMGLTKNILKDALTKNALSKKYRNELTKDYIIDEAKIRRSLHKSDYSSDQAYERAVVDEIRSEKERQFEPVYNKIKSKYDITINFDYWDTLKIGSLTVKES